MKKKYFNSKTCIILFVLLISTLAFGQVPSITNFTPNSACSVSGSTVVITGTNFTAATAVQFNGVNATSFVVNNATQITAVLPTVTTTGPITVTRATGTGTSSANFTATAPPGDQVSYGNNAWIGYVYGATNGGNPPSNAFTTNYIGNITQAEMFDLNLGSGSITGPNLCRSYADNFAIRFKMNKDLPAGNYTFNVGGDDGYRLSVDGGATFIPGLSNYAAHSYSSSTQTVFLSGNTNFVLEYFENGGLSRVQFSYTYCPVYSLTSISAVSTTCTTAKSSTVSLSSSAAGLPLGTYTVSYTLSFNGNSVVYTAPMTVTTAGSGQFTANLSPLNANNSTTIRVTNIASSTCSNLISTNNTSNTVNMYAAITPVANSGFASCSTWNAQWNNNTFVSGYFLDVATTSTFSAGTFVAGYENLNVGNVIIYAITGLTPGNTYYYRVRNNNLGCGVSVNSNTITFVAGGAVAPVIGTITHPTCSTSTGSFTLTNFDTANYDYVFTPSAGVVRSGANVTAPPGNYTLNVSKGGCVSANTSFTINSVPTGSSAPSIVSVTQPTCAIPTGTINLGGLPATGTWTLTRSGATASTTTGTGSTTTVSGLTAGSYSFTVTVSSCVSASTASVPINALITTTYNGTSWSVTPPTSDMNGVVSASGTIANDVDLCSCTVNAGVTATVATGVMMRLQNELKVTGTGSITFKDDSSLVQINDVASNSGSIFYERETTPITNFDYTYWSAPVAGQKLIDFAPTTLGDKFLSFDSFVNNWKYENAYTTFMSKGTGYIIRGPQPKSGQPPSTQLYKFTGAPNNGVVSLPIGALGNSVLIGNPYPSALDADKFLDANAAFLEGTIYFWTHNTSLRLASSLEAGTAGSGSYAYTSDDYAAYNRTGGVATYAAPSASSPKTSTPTSGPIVSSNAPTKEIGAGQSFFATSKATGNVQFNNSMRVGYTAIVANSNSQFFKTASTKKTVSTIDKNRIWLDLTNGEGAFKETLLGYITSATNSNESAFDGETYDANAFLDFYSINEEKNLAIQGRALPFDNTELIPLGYRSAIAGEFSINIRDKDGFFTNQKVYLVDKLLDTVFDLSGGTYKFTTAIGAFNERFAIRYSNKTVGVDNVDPITKGVFISTKDKIITIVTGEETIAAAYVYDLGGKQLFAKEAIDTNQMTIANLPAANVVLVVKVVLANGSVLTQKIMY